MEFVMSSNGEEKISSQQVDLNITPQPDPNIFALSNGISKSVTEGIQFPNAQTVRKIVFLSPISTCSQSIPASLSTPLMVQSQFHSTPIQPVVKSSLKEFPRNVEHGSAFSCSSGPVIDSSSHVIEKEIVVEIIKEKPRHNQPEFDSGFHDFNISSERSNSTPFNPTAIKVLPTDSTLGWDGGNSNDSSVDVNKSLTNIKWLDALKFKKDQPVLSKASSIETQRTEPCRNFYKQHEIDRISVECGRTKRPPLSYVHLIQAALYSRTDRKMTLKEICNWIENKFLYYKYDAKPGWKNCIRHNLSLYNIFMRDPTQVKKHGCLWTIRDGCSPRSKATKDKSETVDNTAVQATAMIPIFHSRLLEAQKNNALYYSAKVASASTKANGSKKGPQPILPRLNTMQTFALVPIQQYQALQGAGQTTLSPYYNGQNSLTSCSGQSIPVTVNYQHQPPLCTSVSDPCKTAESKIDLENQPPKYKIIAPKRCPSESHPPVQNILQEAWLQAQNISDCEISENVESLPVVKNKKKKTKNAKKSYKSRKCKSSPSLPKPKIYKKSSKENILKNTNNKSEKNLLDDSSDGEDFFSSLGAEVELPSPLQQLLETPSSSFKSNAYVLSPLNHLLKTPSTPLKSNMTTSTPFKGINILSPPLPSPIKGPSPLRQQNLCDGSFLDVLKDLPESEDSGKNSATKLFPERTSADDISPNLSWIKLNLNFSFSTPDKNDSQTQHNFSNFLADIDPHFLEEGDIAFDLSTLNWSTSQSTTSGQ